jgi:alpha-glucosidase (family GH31 glycosyl hydrolase)
MKENASSGPGIVKWWKPTPCSLIDWYNPEAVAWWKSLMDKALAYGIDGWKCDGSDFLLYDIQNFKSYFYSPYLQGNIPSRNDYSERYYRIFHEYTRQKLGNDRVVMCRPIDNYGYPFGGNLVAFAPKDISYACWVGDQDSDFNGLKAALNNMYESYLYGYYSFGSDIGGYRTDEFYPQWGRSKTLFIRWAQVGAFSGLMENGGGGEHRPWMFDQQTNEIYKKLVIMRNKYLVGYLMENMSKSVAQNKSLMRFFNKTDYSFMLGDDIYVMPILSNNGTVTVNLPSGSNWVYLYDKTKVYEGGQSFTKTYSLEEFPVFIKQGTKLAEVITP